MSENETLYVLKKSTIERMLIHFQNARVRPSIKDNMAVLEGESAVNTHVLLEQLSEK